MTTAQTMLLGTFVADAASLGLHWLYDPSRIDKIATARGSAAFIPPDLGNFAGVAGYFAHGARRNGQLTQYGEVLHLAVRSLLAEGRFDPSAYRSAFAAHFGAGGAFTGYIDRPTRGALANIAAEADTTGIDDDQLPAIATLPALVAAGHADQARAAREITNINTTAELYAGPSTALLQAILSGASVAEALSTATETADPQIRAGLQAAISTDESNSTLYGEVTGRACHLPMAIPLIWHILSRSTSYAEAVERNIRAGGDSAGRALLLGAAMGAAHGLGTPSGMPLAWILSLQDGATLWSDIEALV